MKKQIAILLILMCMSPLAFGQIDTAFWFTAPSLTTSHIPDNIWLVVVTYGDGADVSISQPARPRTLMTERRIEANSTFTYSLKSDIDYRNTIETQADQTAHDNGILVRSSVPVSVYYVATANNSEIYTLKGQHGLGTDFVVPMQNRRACNHTKSAYCSIEMVATEDNTTITVETTQPTNELETAGTITITLNRGQSYAIRSRVGNTPAANHLGGTHIKSDKPIAVNTTDDSATTGNDKDLIGEQLVPTYWSGNHYIAVSNNSDNEYAYFFTIDNQPATIYTTDGTTETLVGTVQSGGTLEYKLQKLSAQKFYTKDNQQFILYQITGNGGELSGTVLPALNCSGSDEVSYIPALNTVASNVTILTRTEFISGFSVNGDPARLPASVFLPVPGDTAWSYTPSTIIQLEGSEKTLRIRNHLGVFHLGVMDATTGAVSYGYFSNFGSISMSCSSMNDYYYAGDDIQLHLVASETFDQIWWEGPRGIFGENEGNPVIYNATMADAGMYIVNGVHNDGCEVTPDTFYLTILDTMALYREEYVCHGDPVTIRSTGEKPFEWYKDDELMAEQTSHKYTYTPTTSSTFVIASTTPGIDIFSSTDTAEYTYTEQKDTSIIWADTYMHCMPGVEYVYTVSLGVNGKNPVPPRLLLYVNGEYSEQVALPNNSTGKKITLRFTPKDRYAVMRLVAVNTKPGRHFQVESMSLKPVLSLTETIDIYALPAPVRDSLAVLDYCDTLPAYQWRDKEIIEPGLYRDTTWSSYGCDSIYHALLFDTVHCVPPCPVPYNDDVVLSDYCDTLPTYIWRNRPITAPGLYLDTTFTDIGCDSIYHSLLFDTIHCCPVPKLMQDTNVTMCDSLPYFEWRGRQLTESGDYGDTIRSRGCDSLYYYLHLNVVYCIPDPISFSMDSALEICDGETSVAWPIHIRAGKPEIATISYADQTYTLPITSARTELEIPIQVEPNRYAVNVVLSSPKYPSTDTQTGQLTIYYDPAKVFTQKWDNVLAIFSPQYSGYPDYTWAEYHWYKDHMDLNQSYSYYRIAEGAFLPEECYQVLLKRKQDGVWLFTCPYCIAPAPEQSTTPERNTNKVIRDGQLIIVIDGIEYNAEGHRL